MPYAFNVFSGTLDYYEASGTPVPSTALRYVQDFNATTDWGSPSGGYYTITITAATHGKGINPAVKIRELVGGNYEDVSVDQILVNSSGDVSFRVLETPDLRFAGRTIII